MAGKKDIVDQALKLIAGGVKETAPTVAERTAKNLDVFNTAKRLGEDTNDLAKLQETKRLMEFHKGLMGDVGERAKSLAETVRQMKEAGAFPMEIGTRYTTEHSRRTGQSPWTVTNYYVDPKNPQGNYGYYVRRDLPDGGYEESISKIRDPKLEALHGPEKWEELQRGFTPMTGPKVVKQAGGRTGYQTKGRVVGDVVDAAMRLIAGVEPQKTAKAYKLFRQKDGKLYPLFVDANEEVALGQWLKAKAGEQAASGKVKSKIGELAYRPGWHAGDLPIATHIGARSHGNPKLPPDTRPSDQVWAEVDMADDVDWQKIANERARMTKKGTPDPKTAHITDQVPYGGYYRYKTNPNMTGNWMIGGDMRVNRVLTDDEVKAINEAAGVSDLPRREGYGPGGVIDDIVKMAGKIVSGAEKTPAFKMPPIRPSTDNLSDVGYSNFDHFEFGGDNPIPYGDRPMDARLGHQEARDEEFLVFDPRRVKSAISNTGEYDFANPDITKAGGGQVREGYSGQGRVKGRIAKSIADEAIDLAKRLVGAAPEKKTIKGSDLIAKSPGLSEDPFKYSKFSKPLGEMEYTVEKLPNMEPYKELDPYDLVKQNALIAGHISDRTAAGRNLVTVGSTDLVEPLRQRGGADYQRTTLNAWANRPGAAKGLNRKLNEAAGYEWDKKEKMFVPKAEGPEEAPLYTTPVFMGASSANSSHMVGIPLIRMIPNLPISQADKLAFDAMMSQRFPGWPGINKTKEAEEFMYKGKIPGSAISKFVKYAAAKKWKGAGFPDVEEVMFSSMDPRLVGVPQGSTGFGFKEFNPGRTPIIKTNDYHPDYPAAIPGKEYAGGFRYQVPQSLLLPDWWKSLSPELRDPANATKAQHTLMTQVPIQRATPEWADNILKYWEENPMPWGYATGGEVDDDIDDALRIAKDVGGSTPVMMEDAKGNKYDAQGNIIPPTNPGPNPARRDMTPEQVGRQAAQDPATYDALMERYAIPDRDIAEYEALRTTVGQQPQAIQQMTHVGDRPRREMTINMPLFGGEYSMGTAPYDVAEGIQGAAQTAYDFKTMPAYFFPPTAPFALGADILESRLADDPLGFALNAALTPQGASAAKSAIDMVRRNPKAVAATVGAGTYLSPDEAQAGPERWFSKLLRAAEALPMEKMTGEQALAMLRKSAPQEEIKWTGLEGFASDNPVTTKKALLDFIKRNQVQTQDVILGGKPARRDAVVPSETAIAPYKERWDELVAQNRAINEVMLLPPSQRDADIDDLLAQRNDIQYEMDQIHDKAVDATIEEMGGLGQPLRYGPGTRYEQYNTLGGEDYRETLITVPSLGQRNVFEVRGAFPHQFETREKAEKYISDLNAMLENPEFEALHDNLRRFPSSIYEVPLENQGYRSQHWDEPNIIGHIRTQMLTANPPGANRPLKLFNVDENQSDMAQAGRKQGFVTIEDRMNYPNMSKQYDAMNAQRRKLETLVRYGDDANPEVQAASGQLAELDRQMQALSDKMASIRGGGVPAAPYVTSTQGWTDLSIKKALDQAIDSGADYFTFTPGEVQAARYDLSKHIGKVQYNPDDGSLLAYDPKGKMVINESVNDPSDLDEFVGAELAEKLRAEEESRRYLSEDAYGVDKDPDTGEWYVHIYGEPTGEAFSSKRDAQYYINEMIANDFSSSPVELSGLDLRTGGEGMIDYYNNIYKKRVEKVVKDLTGKKVQWEVLPAETAEGIVPRLGFRIDDDLREAKFPTFASGGIVNKALELTRDY